MQVFYQFKIQYVLISHFQTRERKNTPHWYEEEDDFMLFVLLYMCEAASSAVFDVQTHMAMNTMVVITWD